MKDFVNALKENKDKKPRLADIQVGSLSEVASGKLTQDPEEIVGKKKIYRPRQPDRGATDAAFRQLRDKLKKDPKHSGYRKQMKEFLKFNPSFRSAE